MGKENNCPVSSVEEISKKGLSSVIFDLQERIPGQSDEILKTADSFIKGMHDESLKANQNLSEIGLDSLDQNCLEVIELFYQKKSEYQFRERFSLSLKKTVCTYLSEIENLSGKITKYNRNIPSTYERNLLMREIGINWKDNELIIDIPVSNNLTENLTFSAKNLRNLKLSILSSFPKDELSHKQKESIQKHENELEYNKIGKYLFGIVQSNPILFEKFISRFKNDFNSHERFIKRKIHETTSILSAVLNDYQPGEKILDLCTGTGDVCTIMKTLGFSINGIDVNDHYLKIADVYRKLINKENGNYLIKADVLNSNFPESDIWVAKHPCSSGIALPDSIIQKFTEDNTAKRLYLLTCCAHKSIDCCPLEYKKHKLTTDEEWNNLCSEAFSISWESEDRQKEIKSTQNALMEINRIRMQYLQEILHINTELLEIPETIMNQMIIAKK